jgi:hypothetical protein
MATSTGLGKIQISAENSYIGVCDICFICVFVGGLDEGNYP